jgi:DNA-binding GntR family transcriptional regulator
VKGSRHSASRTAGKRAAVTSADRVFSQIVFDIHAGVIRPRDAISERDVVHRFGVSRTPAREAIKRLFGRGFLEVGPRRVAIIKEVTEKDLRDLYDLRLRLEAEAANLTAKYITEDEVAKLRRINREFARAFRARDLGRMLDVRAQFHAVLVQATQNRWLAKVLMMLRDEAYVVRHAHWEDPARAQEAIKMHQEMIDALTTGDTARYRKVTLQQIKDGLSTYLSKLRAAPRTISGENTALKRNRPRT